MYCQEQNYITNMYQCIFCKIVKGELPCYKVYETKEIITFLDINPYTKGHTLVVPKKHSNWLWDMDTDDYLLLEKATYRLAKALRKVFNTDWIEKVVAGIGVQHTHIHLLPRLKDDGLGEIPTKPIIPKPTENEMKKIAKKIIFALS